MSIKKTTNISKTQLTIMSVGLILILILLFENVNNPSNEKSYKVVKLVTGEWIPYSGEEIEKNGITSAIVSYVFRELGYRTELQFMTWEHAEELAAEGENENEVIGSFPYLETSKRKNSFYFSNSILEIEYSIFYHGNNNPKASEINKIGDLSDFNILLISGYDYSSDIKQYINEETMTVKDNFTAFLELERNKEPYIVIEATRVGERLLEQRLPHLVSQIKTAPLKIQEQLKLMISKRNSNSLTLRNQFNKELERLKKDTSKYNSIQLIVDKSIDNQRSVMLQSNEKNNIIYAFKDKNKEQCVIIPSGSKAIIKEWDEAYLKLFPYENQNQNHNPMVKIKLINGPFSQYDSILYVDAKSIKLIN